jgi:hypothetical protein
MRSTTVEVKSLVTVREFERRMRPVGTPLLVRGWMGKWAAMSKWSLEFFQNTYGQDRITIRNDENGATAEISMREYVDYICDPHASPALTALAEGASRRRPFYCLSYKPFRAHPELWDDLTIPPFVADWWPYLNDEFTATHFPTDQGWVFLGAAGSAARLHQDSHHTIAWLAQVVGRKEYFLFAPEEATRVYDGAFDPTETDLLQFPLAVDATCYRCVLEPGEMLFLPPDWWHYARALDASITVSCNFVNHLNFGDYLRAAFGARLPHFLGGMPGKPRQAGPQPDQSQRLEGRQ